VAGLHPRNIETRDIVEPTEMDILIQGSRFTPDGSGTIRSKLHVTSENNEEAGKSYCN